jgi:hypothetical protein
LARSHKLAIFFVLIALTYVNFRRNPLEWVKAEAVPAAILGISAENWFALAYLALALTVVALFRRHRRQPLEFIPPSTMGKAQLLYLVFLWWVVIGNFERSVVAFAPQRLITEGVIFLNALVSTLVLLIPIGALAAQHGVTGHRRRLAVDAAEDRVSDDCPLPDQRCGKLGSSAFDLWRSGSRLDQAPDQIRTGVHGDDRSSRGRSATSIKEVTSDK